MIGTVAQFEKSLIAQRVKPGLEHARAKGKMLGRPPLRKLKLAETRELRRQRVKYEAPFRVLAKKSGVSVWTAHRPCAGRAAGFQDHEEDSDGL
jgi:DNA invertase Pin-like site-specific DNA recombinase